MTSRTNQYTINRLTALWALSEGGLGGILHAIQSPFTGLVIGSLSILLISLIAYFSDNVASSIFRSLLVVLIIKVAISPYSPPTAYLAVIFQASMAAWIFKTLPISVWSTMLLGALTLVESAIQKLLVLTFVYSNTLWESIDAFGNYITTHWGFLHGFFSTQILVTIYLWVYLLLGLFIGYFIYTMIEYLDTNQGNVKYQIKAISFDAPEDGTRKKRFFWKMAVVWLATLALILSFIMFSQEGKAVWQNGLYVLLRSGGILLVWYYLIGPYFTKWLRSFLEKKKSRVQAEVDTTLTLLPLLRKVVLLAWNENKGERGLNRWRGFIGDTILYSIHLQID